MLLASESEDLDVQSFDTSQISSSLDFNSSSNDELLGVNRLNVLEGLNVLSSGDSDGDDVRSSHTSDNLDH